MSIPRRVAIPVLAICAVGLAVVVAGGAPIGDPNGWTIDLSPPGDAATESVELTRTWLSDTERRASGNHHAATGARIDGQSYVFAPISGGVHDHGAGGASGTDHTHASSSAHDHGDEHHAETHSSSCGLYALNGSNGAIEWRRTVPAENCSIHSVADPTVADLAGVAGPTVLATSTTERLTGYRAHDGEQVLARPLATHGYTRPAVGNLTADPGMEILAVDIQGNATLFAAGAVADGDGSDAVAWTRRWSRDLDGFIWAQPQILEHGDRIRIVVAVGDGRLVSLTPSGAVAWNRTVLERTDGLTWASSVTTDPAGDPAIVVASSGGAVVLVDAQGRIQWRRDIGDYAAVRATRDIGASAREANASEATSDARPLVFATNRAGEAIALDARSGETVWRSSLTDADVQMTPPPSIGDVVGGPAPELVAPTNDGQVHVLDPLSGDRLASGGRSAPIFTHASLVEIDGDPHREIVVTYGDGRIARFDASEGP